jgi:hypothetical protein
MDLEKEKRRFARGRSPVVPGPQRLFLTGNLFDHSSDELGC